MAVPAICKLSWPPDFSIAFVRSRGTASWNNTPGTPVKLLRRCLKDWGWREISPWKWKRQSLVLQAPARNEVEHQCHQLRMSWRESMLRRHEAAEWRRVTSPLQMHAEINNLDLEKVRKTFVKSDAPARAILLGSTVSFAWLGRAREHEDPRCPWCGRVGTFGHVHSKCAGAPFQTFILAVKPFRLATDERFKIRASSHPCMVVFGA